MYCTTIRQARSAHIVCCRRCNYCRPRLQWIKSSTARPVAADFADAFKNRTAHTSLTCYSCVVSKTIRRFLSRQTPIMSYWQVHNKLPFRQKSISSTGQTQPLAGCPFHNGHHTRIRYWPLIHYIYRVYWHPAIVTVLRVAGRQPTHKIGYHNSWHRIAGVKLHHSLNLALCHPEFLSPAQYRRGHPKLLQLETALSSNAVRMKQPNRN